jgi:hypothetical protein
MAVLICTCGCNRNVSRRTIVRHLNGRGTKSTLIAQQKKLTGSLRRQRQKIKFNGSRNTDSTVIQDVDDAPIQPLSPIQNGFPDSQAPFSGDLLQHPSDPMDPFYETGSDHMPQYNPPHSMMHTADHSDDEGSDSTSESEGGNMGSSEEYSDDDSDNDAELWSEDAELWSEDAEPWLRGMSAISRLEEAFEQEAAARGTIYPFY